MKVYRLTTTCPYYGDVEENGIFTSIEKVNEAKEIICRNIGIEDYEKRFSVEEVELDQMPYDREKELGIKKVQDKHGGWIEIYADSGEIYRG